MILFIKNNQNNQKNKEDYLELLKKHLNLMIDY